jgi:acyl-CoA synthetase (AMP-forming)/AMP-acid ligase II
MAGSTRAIRDQSTSTAISPLSADLAEQLEELIATLPGVRDVAVGPIAHPILGQVPAALIVREEAAVDLPARIRAACIEAFSRAKAVARVVEVSAIPRTAYGKIDRPPLRKELERLIRARG